MTDSHSHPAASPDRAAPSSRIAHFVRKGRSAYFFLMKTVIVVSISIITALIFINVVLRYGFNSGLYFTEEVSRLLFVWLVFIGSLLVLHERGHIAVDMVTRQFPRSLQVLSYLVAHCLMLGITLLLLTGGWTQMVINLNVGSPATNIPMSLFYAAGVLFAGISSLVIISDIVQRLRYRHLSDAELPNAITH